MSISPKTTKINTDWLPLLPLTAMQISLFKIEELGPYLISHCHLSSNIESAMNLRPFGMVLFVQVNCEITYALK